MNFQDILSEVDGTRLNAKPVMICLLYLEGGVQTYEENFPGPSLFQQEAARQMSKRL